MSFSNEIEWKTSKELVDYEQAVEEMESRVAEIHRGYAPELVWCLEHPSLYTIGTSGKEKDILNSDRCPIYKTGRGGQVTYHGPGQRIVYVLLNLKKRNPDVRAYVQTLESWVIKSLAHYDVKAYSRPGRVGLWVPRSDGMDDKIAAIGVRVKKWVSYHGVAINVNPDLSFYKDIVPCGIREHGVTSLSSLGCPISLEVFDQTLQDTFSSTFS